jgi:glycosyltransferase involved in cell wall biosynthesis
MDLPSARFPAMRIAGFTLVANAVRLDFPIREALHSILPLCDELVVNLGPSDDATEALIRELADPRIRLITGAWDRRLRGAMLALETQRALEACRADWAIYIQADEVLHDQGVERLRDALRRADSDPRVEGLLVDFTHFYGGPEWIGTGRSWYRREVRVVRTGIAVRSHEEAQGFRVGAALRKIRARASGASYYHYGWARSLTALKRKREIDNALYYGGRPRRADLDHALPWEVGLRPFRGSHPVVMEPWVQAHRAADGVRFAPSQWTPRRVSLALSLGLERLTGWRPFEFRNYVEV